MSHNDSPSARHRVRSASAAREPLAASHRVLVSLPDGRWLSLDCEHFDAAVIAGAKYMALSARSPTVISPEPLLDVKQAAAQLGISDRWLADSARAGIAPHHKFGRDTRYRVSDVAAYFWIKGAPSP